MRGPHTRRRHSARESQGQSGNTVCSQPSGDRCEPAPLAHELVRCLPHDQEGVSEEIVSRGLYDVMRQDKERQRVGYQQQLRVQFVQI